MMGSVGGGNTTLITEVVVVKCKKVAVFNGISGSSHLAILSHFDFMADIHLSQGFPVA